MSAITQPCPRCGGSNCDPTDLPACLERVVEARDHLQSRLDEMDARFRDHAAEAGVPVVVVADAAAHTFDMLDVEQQVDLIEEALKRWSANRKMIEKTGVVVAENVGEMKADLVYRLQHEHFDLVYAIAMRRDDAPGGSEHSAWLITPPRPGETGTPTDRTIKALEALVEALRYSRKKFEGAILTAKTKLAVKRKQGKERN